MRVKKVNNSRKKDVKIATINQLLVIQIERKNYFAYKICTAVVLSLQREKEKNRLISNLVFCMYVYFLSGNIKSFSRKMLAAAVFDRGQQGIY